MTSDKVTYNKEVKKKSAVDTLRSLELGPSSAIRKAVWRTRVGLRDLLGGRDILETKPSEKSKTKSKIRRIYRKADEFIAPYFPNLTTRLSKKMATKRMCDVIELLGYTVVDKDEGKPWGAYYRFSNTDTPRFLKEFFPGLSMDDVQLGNDEVELSPKFLLVSPGQRLSWQLHDRRAELWRFLNDGAFHKSMDDMQGERVAAPPDTIVQFQTGERHRLCAFDNEHYTLVAEIWQHTDPGNPSDESDIMRLQDDYSR